MKMADAELDTVPSDESIISDTAKPKAKMVRRWCNTPSNILEEVTRDYIRELCKMTWIDIINCTSS